MGRLSDALKALFGSNKTTGTYVPLVTSNGTPNGNMSMDNLASVLGVVKWKGSVTGVNTPVNTGISVNAGNGGETLLALCSGHSGAGNLTTSAIYMLRFGYNGGNLSVIQIARLSGASDAAEFTFAVSDNTLTVAGPHGSNYIKLISNKV